MRVWQPGETVSSNRLPSNSCVRDPETRHEDRSEPFKTHAPVHMALRDAAGAAHLHLRSLVPAKRSPEDAR